MQNATLRARVINPETKRKIFVDGKVYERLIRDGYVIEGDRLVLANFKPKAELHEDDCAKVISILEEAHENHLIRTLCTNQYTNKISPARVRIICELRKELDSADDVTKIKHDHMTEWFSSICNTIVFRRYLRYEYQKIDILVHRHAIYYVNVLVREAEQAGIKDSEFYHTCGLLTADNLVEHYMNGGKHITELAKTFYPAILVDCLYMYFSIKYNIACRGLRMHDDLCYVLDKYDECKARAVDGEYSEVIGNTLHVLKFES